MGDKMKVKKKAKNKKIIISIMTVIFAVALYVPYIPKMKALSNVTSSNSYGGYTWQIHDTMFDMSGNVTLSSGNISMNLNGHYNGSFTINISLSTIIDSTGISYSNTINNYGFICNGCIINGYDSSHLYVSIYDSNYWEIEIIPIKNPSITNWKSILNAFDILSITGWSMTKLNEITATQITTISNTLTSINSNISTTNSRLTTTNTELHNIYNSIGNSAQYGTIQTQLHMMGVNTSSMINEIQDIDTHLSGYLTGIIDNQTVNIWDLQNDANYSLNNIETTLNTINSNINDYTTQLNSIQTTLNNIDTNISNINNLVNTINYTGHTDYNWKHCNAIGDTLEDIVSDANYGRDEYYYLPNSVLTVTDVEILHIRIPFWIGLSNTQVSLELYTNNNQKMSGVKYYLNFRNYRYIDIYLDVSGIGGNNYYIKLIANQNIRGVGYITDNHYYEKLPSSNIDYWTLKSYIEQYMTNRELLSAINNINMSVTNTTIQDTQTNITDYNTIYNQVSNVEQTYINEYNTNNTTLQSIINDKKGIPDNIINVSTDIESKMEQLFQVPEFKYIFALIISGCVLLALLG